MSHTNQTANYHLPQFIGTDKPAWLVDVNQAMADIDTQMKANETASATAEADAQSALSGVGALNSQVSSLQTSVTALETAQPLDEAQIETNRQNIATNAQNIVEIDNRLGHTSIAGIGDGTVTGAVKANNTAIGGLDTRVTALENATDEYVEVTADGVEETYDLLGRLYALIDFTKFTDKSVLIFGVYRFNFESVNATGASFRASNTYLDESHLVIQSINVGTANKNHYTDINGTITNSVHTVPTVGTKLKLVY